LWLTEAGVEVAGVLQLRNGIEKYQGIGGKERDFRLPQELRFAPPQPAQPTGKIRNIFLNYCFQWAYYA
jgi:hypothetical protein